MSTPQKFIELRTSEPRKFSLIGYEIVADNVTGSERILVLKKRDTPTTVPVPPTKSATKKPRVRRTKAQLAAAAQAKAASTQAYNQTVEEAAELNRLQKAGD